VIVGDADGPGVAIGEAVRWNTDGTVTRLGTLEGNGQGYSTPSGINNSGTVAGYSSGADGYTHAVTWTPAGAIRALPDLPGAAKAAAYAYAINADGTIVGEAQAADFYRTAVRWSPDGSVTDLRFLPGRAGGTARGISNTGVIVGDSTGIATRWTG
jgi:probable HAF family extracellular repeat protein